VNTTATPLRLPEVKLIRSRVFPDARGIFAESARLGDFRSLGLPDFVQDNESLSLARGTVRGLHFQRPPHAQGKLVRVLSGAIFDVAVDIRPDSDTFGQWAGVVLREMSGEQLFVPRGFAHGFCTLEERTIVAYRCDAYYAPEFDDAILFSDPDVAIAWPIEPAFMIASDKDRRAQSFAAYAAGAKGK